MNKLRLLKQPLNEQSIFCSIHTHTLFCDGKDDVETLCRAAYEKDLCAIGFSAHAPLSRQINAETEWHLKEEQVEQYTAEVLAAKERWQGKIAVFLGYEADYIKGIRSPSDSDIVSLNLDYIIGSVHYLSPENGAQLFAVDDSEQEFNNGIQYGFNGNVVALMHSYYDAVLEMITAGGFDVLGHADIINKNNQDKNYWPMETEICRQREIASALAKTNIMVEVNTGGLNRRKTKSVYPSLSFLRIIREYDIPVIITADAHCAEDINNNYDIAVKTLQYAGYKKHVIFSN